MNIPRGSEEPPKTEKSDKLNHQDKLAGWKEINRPPHPSVAPYHLQDAAVTDQEYIERLIDQEEKSGQDLLMNKNGEIDEESMTSWHQWIAAFCETKSTKEAIITKESEQINPPPQSYPRLSYKLSHYHTK